MHPYNEIPHFLSGKDFQVKMSDTTKSSYYARDSSVMFSVQGTQTDGSLKNSYSISKSRCKFEDENEDMNYAKEYSEANCLFECKLEIVHNFCGCLPWFLLIRNSAVNVCDIFGSICYEQKMRNVFESDLDCDCHPDCNTFKYTAEIDGENPEEISNPKLLDIERVAKDGSAGFNQNLKWDI